MVRRPIAAATKPGYPRGRGWATEVPRARQRERPTPEEAVVVGLLLAPATPEEAVAQGASISMVILLIPLGISFGFS